tara:strand:- start:3458 stop:3952 length:495 start_codon:yes stop_codon:yes gene_type:complete
MLMKKGFSHLKNEPNKQTGFSLLEVIIALVISNIALLGLVAGQLKSLQYINNNFQYTVSIIHAKNVAERILIDVCELSNGTQVFDLNYIESNLTTDSDLDYNGSAITSNKHYQLGWDELNSPMDEFTTQFPIFISWTDLRMDDLDLNKVVIMASFPTADANCNE